MKATHESSDFFWNAAFDYILDFFTNYYFILESCDFILEVLYFY